MDYKINDLLYSYHHLQQLQEEIQKKYFEVLEKIDSTELATVDVSYETWAEVREYENTHRNEEAEVISQFKYYLNDLIM